RLATGDHGRRSLSQAAPRRRPSCPGSENVAGAGSRNRRLRSFQPVAAGRSVSPTKRHRGLRRVGVDPMRAMAGERHRPGIQCLRNARPPRKVLHMSLQALSASVALWLTLCGPALAQDNDPDASPIWQKIRADLFGGTRIESGEQMLMLETPRRAEDAAIVPVAVRARFPQAANRYIDKLWLIVDNNPSPIAAVFHFTPDSGRADIETRIRVEQYPHV